jgi:hypothetical protein
VGTAKVRIKKKLRFTPLDELPEVPPNPRCQMAQRRCTFRPPHRRYSPRERLEDAGHVVLGSEIEGRLALVESLQRTLF